MSILDDTQEALVRVQQYDSGKLPRRDELGAKFTFEDAVEPAQELISLFKRIPVSALAEFPDALLTQIKQQADQVNQLFSQILGFDETQGDATNQRTNLIQTLRDQYGAIFNQLYPLISYAVARTVDFQRLEAEGRAAVQAIKDATQDTVEELDEIKIGAQTILENARSAATEIGVAKQAIFFETEAKEHGTAADTWRKWTQRWAFALAVYGVATFFIHKIPYFKPENAYDTVQLVTSKLVIFFGLSFMLFLSAKNFMSHSHNKVVNKHRQNALKTFTALVDAGGTPETRDAILHHAASSIFKPQDSGYIKSAAGDGNNTTSIIDLVPKTTMRLSDQ